MVLESGEPIEVVKPAVPVPGVEANAAPEGEAVTHDGTEALPPRKSRRERAVERATAPLLERIKQLEAGQPQRAAQAEAVAPPAVAAQPKPKRADFADDEAFEDALVKWGNEKFAAEKAFKDAQAAVRQHCERNLRNYAAQVKEAQEKYPDWDELKEKFDNEDIFIGNGVQMAILELENGADVIYHLMRHPDYAEKLGRMSQPSAVMEVGRLSARLLTGASSSGEGYEYRRPKARVPAPVRTVSTGGTSEPLTFAELAARPNYPGKWKDLKHAQR
jgi:hypothetical protein